MGIESTRFLPRHLRRDHWANPRLAARPISRHRYRLRVGEPITRRPGAVARSGPLSVTSPDFPAYLQRTPSPGVGRPTMTTVSAPPARDSVPPTVGGPGIGRRTDPTGCCPIRDLLHHRGAL